MSRTILAILVVCLCAGCPSAKMAPPRAKQVAAQKEPEAEEAKVAQGREQAGARDPAEAAARKQKEAAKAKPVERKIIYTATIEVIVEDFDQASSAMLDLLKERGGYVAHSDVDNMPGAPRQGTWTVRVPAERFDEFRTSLSKLGEVRRNKVDSDDVTDRYYDTEAAVKNKEAREKALRELYKQKLAGSKLEDLLAVDREINAVRTEINVGKGRLQRWDKEVAFSTATITLRDRKGYVPPLLPDFTSRIGRTFADSVDALLWAGKELVLIVVALIPWLVVLAILASPAVVILRRRRGTTTRAEDRPGS
jgi:hypothetical protein